MVELKVLVLMDAKKYKEAQVALEALPQNNSRYQQLAKQLKDLTLKNSLRSEYQLSTFNQKDMANWHLGVLEYSRQTRPGTLTARLNYANRFDQQAMQAEVDFWPHLSKNTYLYINAGVSHTSLFPDFRAGLEVYRTLPFNMEASVGGRALAYATQTVWLYTGHLGKYFNNYWVALRPFVQYQQQKTHATAILQVRRYWQNPDHYLTLTLAKGSTPTNQVGLQEINRLDANKIGFESRFKIAHSLFGTALLQYEYEEYAERSYRHRYTSGLSLQYKF